jgi:hypothetical protein
MAIKDVEVGDFVLFTPFNGNGETQIGCVLRALTAAESLTYLGPAPTPDAWWVGVNFSSKGIARASDILAVVNCNRTAADDLGPLVAPPLPNPVG